MDIEFPDDAIRAICEQKKVAIKTLGKPCARKLKTRLADMAAAINVKELIAGHPHPLKGNRLGQFALVLHRGVRLVFEPANDPVPQHIDGGIDWSQVTRARVLCIGDYHD